LLASFQNEEESIDEFSAMYEVVTEKTTAIGVLKKLEKEIYSLHIKWERFIISKLREKMTISEILNESKFDYVEGTLSEKDACRDLFEIYNILSKEKTMKYNLLDLGKTLLKIIQSKKVANSSFDCERVIEEIEMHQEIPENKYYIKKFSAFLPQTNIGVLDLRFQVCAEFIEELLSFINK
jgi:hypothetical protein